LFLKQLEEQNSKPRGTVPFQKSHYFSRRISQNHNLKTSSLKEHANKAGKKNPTKNVAFKAKISAVIDFGEYISL